jgi:CHRD domain-containing protein
MKKLWVYAAATVAVAATVAGGSALAGGRDDRGGGAFATRLNGYNEVIGPGSISTVGRGRFRAQINKSANTITYRLTYVLENPATVSHIHFAQRHVGGGVVAFLCGGDGKPDCPAGVTAPATVTGTITPSNVIGPAGQGIEPGSFDELVRAMRAGATYVNVHSTRWPAGEIRGQLGHKNRDDDD